MSAVIIHLATLTQQDAPELKPVTPGVGWGLRIYKEDHLIPDEPATKLHAGKALLEEYDWSLDTQAALEATAYALDLLDKRCLNTGGTFAELTLITPNTEFEWMIRQLQAGVLRIAPTDGNADGLIALASIRKSAHFKHLFVKIGPEPGYPASTDAMEAAKSMAAIGLELPPDAAGEMKPMQFSETEQPDEEAAIWRRAMAAFGPTPFEALAAIHKKLNPSKIKDAPSPAEFVAEVQVQDPDSGDMIDVAIFKDARNGCMLGLDAVMLERTGIEMMADPFNPNEVIHLPEDHEPRQFQGPKP